MADSDVDHGIVEENQGFLSDVSSFLDFQIKSAATIEEYVNQMTSNVAEDVELHLGMYDLQNLFTQRPLCTPQFADLSAYCTTTAR